jgi:serine/threonine protein kinase
MLSGGKLFDKGEYGCIFTPPLECKNETKKLLTDDSSNMPLTKLILKDAANLEYAISKVIRQIPLWKNYFVVSESICEPAPNQKEKELDNCPILDKHKLSDFRILTIPYGGTPLVSYRININNFNFMEFTTHLIEAGAILNLFGIVHRDIHQGNILVDNEEVPRIIDFNLAIPVKSDVTSEKLRHSYNYSLGQEPPDSTLVNAIMLGYNHQRVIDSIIEKKQIIKKIRNILGISQQYQYQELEKFYRDSISIKSGDSVKWFNTYWRTIDSWAIGVNIIDLISKLSLWPEFSSTLKRVSPKLFPVLKKLCAISPFERIDCVQALNYLAPNSFIIRKYGKIWINKVGDGNISKE